MVGAVINGVSQVGDVQEIARKRNEERAKWWENRERKRLFVDFVSMAAQPMLLLM